MPEVDQMEDKKHILFNFASKSRPHKFNIQVYTIHQLCSQPFTILAKIDDDDPQRDQYDLSNVNVVPGLSESKIHAINRGVPESGWDIIVDIADDMVFTKKGFDDIIRQHCGPDDFLLFPEPFAKSQATKEKNDMIVIMMCMGNQYYSRDKYIFNPVFKSLFCDNFATNVAKVRGRFKMVNEDIFYHAHPAAGYGKMDAQYQHTQSFWNQDKVTYKAMMREINDYK